MPTGLPVSCGARPGTRWASLPRVWRGGRNGLRWLPREADEALLPLLCDEGIARACRGVTRRRAPLPAGVVKQMTWDFGLNLLAYSEWIDSGSDSTRRRPSKSSTCGGAISRPSP